MTMLGLFCCADAGIPAMNRRESNSVAMDPVFIVTSLCNRSGAQTGLSLHTALALDLGDLLVERLVVLARRDLVLRALGPGEDPEHGARGIDHRDPLRDPLDDVRLLAPEDPEVAVGGRAVDGHLLRGLLLLLLLDRAALRESGRQPDQGGGGEQGARVMCRSHRSSLPICRRPGALPCKTRADRAAARERPWQQRLTRFRERSHHFVSAAPRAGGTDAPPPDARGIELALDSGSDRPHHRRGDESAAARAGRGPPDGRRARGARGRARRRPDPRRARAAESPLGGRRRPRRAAAAAGRGRRAVRGSAAHRPRDGGRGLLAAEGPGVVVRRDLLHQAAELRPGVLCGLLEVGGVHALIRVVHQLAQVEIVVHGIAEPLAVLEVGGERRSLLLERDGVLLQAAPPLSLLEEGQVPAIRGREQPLRELGHTRLIPRREPGLRRGRRARRERDDQSEERSLDAGRHRCAPSARHSTAAPGFVAHLARLRYTRARWAGRARMVASTPTDASRWVACLDCDLLCHLPALPEGASASCSRCGGVLRRRRRNSIERTLAFALAASVLYVVANSFPFLDFDMKGRVTETTLVTGVVDLWKQGVPEIATLVGFTAVGAPLVQLTLLLYVLLPVYLGRVPWV